MSQIIKDKQDLKYLSFTKQRQSSGTAGTFIKVYSIDSLGQKLYYKLSAYNSVDGVYGHESVNEIIASRVLDVLNYPHVDYDLIYAEINIDGKAIDCYISSSIDYKNRYDKKTSLEDFYDNERMDNETINDFLNRFGFLNDIYKMLVFDYLIANRDRHGANIEVVKNSKKRTIKLSPLFDHGLSLLFSTRDEELNTFDVMNDFKVQSYGFSFSLLKNIQSIPKNLLPIIPKYSMEYEYYIFKDLDGIISEKRINKLKEMIRRRWEYYETLQNNR